MSWLHTVIDVPAPLHGATAAFWESALGWPLGDPWPGHPELRSFEPEQAAPYVHLQQVDGPPRVHVDVEVDDPQTAIEAAVQGGARVDGRFERWVAMRSPGGLPFCVLPARAHQPPQPVQWPAGHRSRLVQVCIDSPVDRHDDEVAFWRGLLAGRWVGYTSDEFAEFAGKWHDDAGSPLQLLFQRVDEPGGVVRAHLDLGTDGQPAEVQRLIDLGAVGVGPGHGGWHVLRDPAGMAFCATENSPEQTTRRDLH